MEPGCTTHMGLIWVPYRLLAGFPGVGEGGYSHFSAYVGSGPASTVHPKNIRNFKHAKRYLKF